MQHQLIQINQLEKSPQNARRTATGGAAAELRASILAHGILHNLVVTAGDGGIYRVTDGGRRLEALKVLQAEGRLPADYAVPCQVRGEADALETSLAANTVRLAMHPADEFEAFARLIDAGSRPEQVAEHFGKTARHVEQRMKLARVAPALLEAYRAGELTLDGLTAFTITDDHDRQLTVYRSLQAWQKDNPRHIRALLTEAMAEAGGKLARFVGLEAYRAAGGATRADLFGEEVYLEDAELLNALATEKLQQAERALLAEGWGWVEVGEERGDFLGRHGRIHPRPADVPPDLLDRKAALEAELDAVAEAADAGDDDEALLDRQEAAEEQLAEVEEAIESCAAYDPAEMTLAGCYVTIGHDGALAVDKGLVRRQDMALLAGDEATAAAAARKPRGMPETLRRDLEAYRLQAAQVELARHRLIALDLLAFKAARNLLAMRPLAGGPDVHFTPSSMTPTVRRERTAAGDAFSAIAEGLPRAWLHQETEAEQFQAFLALSDRERLDFLAYGVAASLKPQLATGNERTAYELALSLTDADPAAYWRPTRDNYLGRITRDRLLALGREVLGDAWAQARSKDKKGELAAALERAFAEPAKHARTPLQLHRLTHWLPEGMAFTAGGAEEPEADTAARQAA